MSYQIGNKTYTDHPMLDEIVYNCKKILEGIVIKNDVKAGNLETDYSITYAEAYSIIKDRNGYIDFELFPFNQEVLSAYGYPSSDIKAFIENRYAIPESSRQDLTDFANEWFKDMYFDEDSNPIGEQNDYYRTLYGLPPYDTDKEYYVPIDVSILPETYTPKQNADGNYYVHEQPEKILTLLYSMKYIDTLKEQYKGSGYGYLDHMGLKRIPTLKARRAAKWDILYMPNVYDQVEHKFTEFYKINREMYANRSYQEFYAQIGEYYDDLMILTVLAQTFTDMVTDVPEWYIRRDVFDIRSCQYFLESYGVEYYKEIPLKYQIKIVKNLNKLIKYKSTNKNFDDIISIFDAEDTTYIDKYWLYRKHVTDGNGNYSETGDNREDFDLQFVMSNVNESYDDYIRDSRYINDYDSITLQDMYWDGVDDHDVIKDVLLGIDHPTISKSKDFTIEGSKYMSINQTIPVEDYTVESAYFLQMMLSTSIDMSDIKIPIPSIDDTAMFEIPNLFLFLDILTKAYYVDTTDPHSSALEVEFINYNETPLTNYSEDAYDWKKKYIPEVYKHKAVRVYGYNPDLDKSKVKSVLTARHSRDVFGIEDVTEEGSTYHDTTIMSNADYLLKCGMKYYKKLMIDDYIVPSAKISDIQELVDIYENNLEIYHKINDMLANADNMDEKKVLQYVFQELFTRQQDIDFYRLSDGSYDVNLIDILQDRDYVLYLQYQNLMSESSMSARQDNIRVIMGEIIDTLEYYFQGYGLKYLFAFTATESFAGILKYIYLMIKFFKSYKVHFLDPFTTYKTSNSSKDMGGEMSVKAIDNIREWKYEKLAKDKSFADDKINGFNLEMLQKDQGYIHEAKEYFDIMQYYSPDPLSDLVYDGLDAQNGGKSTYKDLNGGVANPKKNYPYETINGGASYLGLMNFRDLNGGMADELYRDYYQINGGYAYHPDDLMIDYWGSQGFNYMFDNGSASNTHFINNTIDINVLGKDIIGNVIISPRASDYILEEYVETEIDDYFEFGCVGGKYYYPPTGITLSGEYPTLEALHNDAASFAPGSYFILITNNYGIYAFSKHNDGTYDEFFWSGMLYDEIPVVPPSELATEMEFGCVGGWSWDDQEYYDNIKSELYKKSYATLAEAEADADNIPIGTYVLIGISSPMKVYYHHSIYVFRYLRDLSYTMITKVPTNLSGDYDMNIYATLANSTVTERWPGLYMANDMLASKAEYDYLVEQKEFISETIMSEVIKFDYIYALLTDEDTRLGMMDRVASDYIYPFSAVLEAVENDGFKNDIKTATNAAANSLYSYFVDENPELIDPFAWEDL